MFINAIFIVLKTENNPNVYQQENALRHVIENCSAIKRKELLI